MSEQATERHYSVGEVAEMWSLSAPTVTAIFRDKPGVVKIGVRTLLRRKRRPRVTLRIPASVLASTHAEMSK